MITKSVFLTFTPQLVSLFGYLWDHKRGAGDSFLELVCNPFPELCENMSTSSVYDFGVTIDGLHGHQLVVAMDILGTKGGPFSYLDDLCCVRTSECDSPYGHPSLKICEVLDQISVESFGKTFEELKESGDEEKAQAVEHKFDESFICFDSLVENSCEATLYK